MTASARERPSPTAPAPGTPAEPTAAAPYWDETLADGRARFRAKIGGLHCSLCTGTIEKALGKRPGVEKVAVSLTHEQALVEYDPKRVRPDELLDTLRDIGYTIWDPRKTRPFEEEEAQLVREGRRLLLSIGFSLVTIGLIAGAAGWLSVAVDTIVAATLGVTAYLILRSQGRAAAAAAAVAGTLGLLALAGGVLSVNALGAARPYTPWIVGAFAFAVVFGVAGHFLGMAWQSLRRGILNQHVLLEAGAFAGLVGGAVGLVFRPAGYPTAAFFAVSVLVANYHVFSEWLSLLVKTRSSQAVKRLLDLQPDTARVSRDGQEVEVGLSDVTVGDVVRVRPGERVPVDGDVVGGHSAVDQAFVTGEPLPVEKSEGDSVIGGSMNTGGTLLVRATAVGERSFLAQVVRSVEDARALKPGILHLVDRVLTVYAPTVLTLATLALVGWIVGPWLLIGQADLERAIFAGLSVLVMGYPCAVGIAAPLSIVRGSGEAADHGILMRTGEAFQAFRSVRTVVLDKTGTLTVGKPTVQEIEPAPGGGSADELLAIAAAAEAASEHPLGQAVLDAALDRGLDVPAVDDFQAVTGRGVTARLAGQPVLVGRPGFLGEHGVDVAPLAGRVATLEAAGRTVIAVAAGGELRGIIALGDALRPGAAAAVAGMRRAGLIPALVSGDNRRAAERVAQAVGIDAEDVHAGVLPEEKAEIVRRLQSEGRGRVAMVGDGINDAPALMQADVGIAMGAGTDIALESADVIILSNRLESILTAREISTRSYRKTQQNVALAFLFNGIGIPVAATGLVYPVWAMVAMALSVTTIFLNSLWGRPSLFFSAVLSVGRSASSAPPSEAPAT